MESTTTAKPGIRWFPAVIGFLAMMGLGGLIAFGVTQARGGASELNLKPAPDFTVSLYSGGTGGFTLSDHQGQPIVLNFWGAWCGPCRAEFPAIQASADEFEDKGLLVFGVNAGGIIRDNEREAKDFLAEQQTTFRTGPDLDDRIALDYRIIRMPTTFFITRDGQIYKKWEGPINETRLATLVEELLEM